MYSTPMMLRRVITTLAVGAVFIGLASVFVPDWTQADFQRFDEPETAETAWESTNPHVGLRSLGVMEGERYRVEIWAGDRGPRYTIYEVNGTRAIGTLLTAEQVAERFPDLPLPSIDFDVPGMLMLADPDDGRNGW